MLSKIFLILIAVPTIGFSQSFNLKTPNVHALKQALEKDNSKNIVHAYLVQQYKKKGLQKREVKMYDFNDNVICAFEQVFKHGIVYTVDQCSEEGGMNYSITFPKTDRNDLMEWIEIMDNNDLSEVENSWNTDKTVYRPMNEEAGCFYTIKETEFRTVVEVWCGC